MACSPRHLLLPLVFLLTTTSSVPTPLMAAPMAAAGQVRIVAGANVTVRTAPSVESSAVAQLPLGTEVRETGPAGLDKTWILVQFDDSREGWVQARLTRSLDPVWPWPVFDEVIGDRLARQGDGFPALAELVSFIERVTPTYQDPDSRARIELARLRAVSRAAAAIPFNAAKREPYASWLRSRSADVVFDEPGGRWMVPAPVVWNVHARHAASSVADEIAWFAVAAGLPGECEGNVACYLSAQRLLHGAYLRAHPVGRHAAESVAAIESLIDTVVPSGTLKRPYQFDRQNDCKDLGAALDGLSASIQNADASRWQTTLGKLAVVRKLCP
jgi:hypothetical protein